MEKLESFTQEDLQKLHELQSRQKRVNRQRKMILSAIDDDPELKDQVIDHLKIEDKLYKIAQLYGTDTDTLYTLLTDPEQISAFKHNYMNAAEEQPSSDDEVVLAEEDSTTSDRNESYYYHPCFFL